MLENVEFQWVFFIISNPKAFEYFFKMFYFKASKVKVFFSATFWNKTRNLTHLRPFSRRKAWPFVWSWRVQGLRKAFLGLRHQKRTFRQRQKRPQCQRRTTNHPYLDPWCQRPLWIPEFASEKRGQKRWNRSSWPSYKLKKIASQGSEKVNFLASCHQTCG